MKNGDKCDVDSCFSLIKTTISYQISLIGMNKIDISDGLVTISLLYDEKFPCLKLKTHKKKLSI